MRRCRSHPNRWIIGLILVIVVITGVVVAVLFHRPEVTPTWTARNSLRPLATPPMIQDDGEPSSLLAALDASLQYLNRKPRDELLQYGDQSVPISRVKATVEDLRAAVSRWGTGPQLSTHLATHYQVFTSTAPSVLFTGYFVPRLRGSRTRSERFNYPLYKVPPDLFTIDLRRFVSELPSSVPPVLRGRLTDHGQVVPFFSRHEIDFGQALTGRDLEIVWVDDPVDAFFLHIQGSGIVELEDGSELRVGYAEKNGQRYVALGAELIQRGKLRREDVSMQSITEYLRAHPDEWEELLSTNPSYVFFRPLEGPVVGNIEVPLTAYRSIAVDNRLFPKGVPAVIHTELPRFEERRIVEWQPFVRIVLIQDTGGAIRGPGRVDLFTGSGEESALIAGHMKREGELHLLLKREST